MKYQLTKPTITTAESLPHEKVLTSNTNSATVEENKINHCYKVLKDIGYLE